MVLFDLFCFLVVFQDQSTFIEVKVRLLLQICYHLIARRNDL